ncbi:MAG: hypothetical protein H0Z39_07610 [Peptococcaceae bacterium]|nr:hypothetical protein [Peptococcaceae bacterium]
MAANGTLSIQGDLTQLMAALLVELVLPRKSKRGLTITVETAPRPEPPVMLSTGAPGDYGQVKAQPNTPQPQNNYKEAGDHNSTPLPGLVVPVDGNCGTKIDKLQTFLDGLTDEEKAQLLAMLKKNHSNKSYGTATQDCW